MERISSTRESAFAGPNDEFGRRLEDREPLNRVLSVVMPCFNEIDTVEEIVKKVLEQTWTAELIIVDDGSTDGTRRILETLTDDRIRVIFQPENRGKGAALRAGFAAATSPFVIVQDADLEYNPEEYGILLGPMLEDKADVVYGSRFLTDKPHRVLFFWHSVGNRLLTLYSNMTTNLNLTDMETCYKLFRREVLESIELTEDRFGVEPEITAKVAAQRWRVWEVGISYAGRTFDEGKKIGWKDGVRAFWVITTVTVKARQQRTRPGMMRTETRRSGVTPSGVTPSGVTRSGVTQ